MSIAFTPATALTKLYNIDPKSAKILTAGIAVFASAAIVSAWNIDIATMGLVGLYVALLGLLLIIVANLGPLLSRVLGTFIVVLIITAVSTIFISSVTTPAWPKPSYCLVKFWLPCAIEEEKYANRNAASIDSKTNIPSAIEVPPALPVTNPSGGTPMPDKGGAPLPVPPRRVFIQFAGMITRDSITELNASLARGGWRMQGASGERIEVAAGLNELRYGQREDLVAATVLADAVTTTGITSSPVVPRYVAKVGSENFELWISK